MAKMTPPCDEAYERMISEAYQWHSQSWV